MGYYRCRNCGRLAHTKPLYIVDERGEIVGLEFECPSCGEYNEVYFNSDDILSQPNDELPF